MKAQDWLDKNYPDKEETYSIYLNQQLEGVLGCSEYKDLRYIFISSSVDSSKLEIKGGSYKCWEDDKIKETEIIPCLPTQTYLNQEYPNQKARKKVKKLDIRQKGLEGDLDLSDFQNLEWLICYNNYLTNLNVNNCQKLKWIYCSNNHLTQIPFLPNPEKITELEINDNNLNPSELTIFSQFQNLERLEIGNGDENKINQGNYNRFTGSCEPLKDLNKLKILEINNTDLTSGWEYLPDSLGQFRYKSELRPDCQLALAKSELEKEIWADIDEDFISYNDKLLKKGWLEAGFSKEQTKKFLEEWNQAEVRPRDSSFINWFLNFKKLDLDWALENEEEFRELRDGYKNFGNCEKCQQPNTSKYWCQSCNARHFQEDFPNWTSGNPQIDKFIQQCQLEATSQWNVLEWIPYEKFTEIEHIADGGFGKVYKAQWKGGSIGGWNNKKGEWERSKDWYGGERKDYQTVALKILTNSQNINQNFLQELTLYKMFKSSVSQMVPCYGISRDREGNYIMVMEYMQEGNLREFLRKNYRELVLKNKLYFLKDITQGLKDIHRKHLVHRDFHSGNIIVEGYNCLITDLGLAKPVNEIDNGQVYGVLPYVAPEVLQGQPYTPKSDIYSLGIIMYEIFTTCLPFAQSAHDTNLALQICQGKRPQFPEQVKYPQLLVDLIKQCWDSEPNNRPTVGEVSEIVGEWFEEKYRRLELKTDTELYHQYQEAKKFNKTLPDEIKYPNHQSQEVWHSKPINTKQITNLLSVDLGLDGLDIGDNQTEQQTQIEIPPKK